MKVCIADVDRLGIGRGFLTDKQLSNALRAETPQGLGILREGRCCLDSSIACVLWYQCYGVVWVLTAKIWIQIQRAFLPMFAWMLMSMNH